MENQVENPISDATPEAVADNGEPTGATDETVSAQDIPAETEEEETPSAFDELELGAEEEGVDRGLVESLKQELESLKAQLDDRNGQYIRIAADFENFRNRTQREKVEQEERVKCSTILDLLPVVDNFERARAQLKPQGEEATTMHNSYQGIYKQLVDGLKRLGVSPMRAEGKDFDPMLHEAMMRQPTDEFSEGTVMEEFQRGYLLGDRVLRHAMVKVAAASDGTITSEGNSDNPSD
jgi:molecular chaperone GrpE